MSIDIEEARRLFPSGIIKKLDCCNFCPYEEILRPNQKKIEVLLEKIPENNHPHRDIIEETCGKKIDEQCYMKYAAMRAYFGDFMLAQTGAVEIFKYDLKLNNLSDALMEWNADRLEIAPEFTNGTKKEYGNYADRFRKIWDLSSRCFNNIEQKSLTILGIYQRVLLDQENFDKEKEILSILREKENERYGGRINLPKKLN